ncbi:MAG: ThiF family adenylyltransferase [Desulfovibrio sp.]|jgi:molybdopterin/thiamine biosynthesis adenylyltransferase|nr:ThiF family adenylyltransferase [Desulfovibrio sp.]
MRMWEALINRQDGFVNFNPQTHAALAATRIAVIGAGGNGTVLDLLVRAGFAGFVIVDPDCLEPTNLNRMPFYPEQTGTPKVECWKKHILTLNPECEVRAHHRGVAIHDALWLEKELADVKIVFLGTTDPEANFVVGRVAARLGIRMIVGPASSGSAVVSTFTHDNGLTMEKVGNFGTENMILEEIDFQAIAARHFSALAFPGRGINYRPEVWEGMRDGTHPARSCGIFVRLANAVMAFEGVKNAIALNGLPLEGTDIVAMPEVQIFDPRTGCAYRYNVLTKKIGIPDWLTGTVSWRDAEV